MKEGCLLCKAPLEYLGKDELMECVICHKKTVRPDVSMDIMYAMNAIRKGWIPLSISVWKIHQKIP